MGHPWIYDDEIQQIGQLNGLEAGTLVSRLSWGIWGFGGFGVDVVVVVDVDVVDDVVDVDEDEQQAFLMAAWCCRLLLVHLGIDVLCFLYFSSSSIKWSDLVGKASFVEPPGGVFGEPSKRDTGKSLARSKDLPKLPAKRTSSHQVVGMSKTI